MAYYVDPEQTCSPDLGVHCLLIHFCPNVYAFYSIAVMQLFRYKIFSNDDLLFNIWLLKMLSGMSNIVDLDQTAPEGAA